MEQLSTKVSSIERSLGRIDRSLTAHKQNAQKEVGSDVAAIGEALQQGQHEIEHVSCELQNFLTAVDDHPQSKQVVLKPQIEWLSRNVTSILNTLMEAERKASLAMEESMNFQSSVGDADQEIAVQERELSEARTKGKDLEARAQRDLAQSLKLIDEAESEITTKNWQISNKQSEASSLRSELSTHRSELSSLETQVANVRARASRKKDKAVGGGLLALSGIFLAPLTGGASLALTVGAGAYSGAKAVEYDDCKDTIRSLNIKVSNLETQIRDADRKVAELASDKSTLEARLSSLRRSITSERNTKELSEKQIRRASEVDEKISTLQYRASTASREAQQAVRELSSVKAGLHEVLLSINEKTTQLSLESSSVQQQLFPRSAGRPQYRRNKAALQSVAEALTDAQAKLPALLPAADIKFLDNKPHKQDVFVSEIALEAIPQLTVGNS